MKKKIEKVIEVPEKVEIKIKLPSITVIGPKGTIEKKFKAKNIKISKGEKSIILNCNSATRREKKQINTIASHITNMIKGAEEGFEYKLQICTIHFPINTKIEKDSLIIKNFIGENKDRVIKIKKGVEVKIDGDIITVTAADKELAGQQAADIEKATRIKAKDKRIFQDGIWIIKKEKGRHK